MADNEKQPSNKPKNDKLALEIGRRISEARNGLGLSQSAVSERSRWCDPEDVGISRAALSLYETGVNKPGAREIRLLCETLKITPNWLLYGSISPAKTLQASQEFLQSDERLKSELSLAFRLAFAMLTIEPEERDCFAGLLFPLATKKIDDLGLSTLMMIANFSADDVMKRIREIVGEDIANQPFRDVLNKFVAKASEGGYSNYGNLRPANLTEEQEENIFTSPPPPREIKDT